MLHTRLCDLLDIEVPIIVAPMGFVTGPELAAAVSDAGGLGILSAGNNPPGLLHRPSRMTGSASSKDKGLNLAGCDLKAMPCVDVCGTS